jgi:hypothetical protein
MSVPFNSIVQPYQPTLEAQTNGVSNKRSGSASRMEGHSVSAYMKSLKDPPSSKRFVKRGLQRKKQKE